MYMLDILCGRQDSNQSDLQILRVLITTIKNSSSKVKLCNDPPHQTFPKKNLWKHHASIFIRNDTHSAQAHSDVQAECALIQETISVVLTTKVNKESNSLLLLSNPFNSTQN